MENKDKTKDELLQELQKLQQENEDLRKSHVKDISDNKLAEESLKESKERFRSIFVSNMLGTFFWDANGDIIDANDAFLAIVGYSREELSRGLLKWNELTPAKYEKIDKEKLKELAERGKINPYEKEYIHKSGRIIPIIISGELLSGSKTRGAAIVIDITERKQVEARAVGLSSIIETSLSEIYVFDITTLKFVYLNLQARNNLGFSNEEIMVLTPLDIKPDFILDTFLLTIKPLLSGEENVINFETIHQRKDGSTYPVAVYLQLSNFEGKQVFVAFITDISMRKVLDETLLKIENLNKILVEYLPHKIFLKDENSNYLICNKNYATDLGITSVEVSGKNDYAFFPINLANDYRKDDKEVLQNGIIKDIEEKYILNEKEMWIHTIKVPIKNANNEIFGVLGIFENITDRKQTENSLYQERQRFKQILDSFPYGIYIIDRDCCIEYLNPILSQEFGDPGTRKCYEYFHNLKEACPWCQNQKVFKGEMAIWNWHSPKNDRDYELVDIPLNNADGSVSKLEIFQDITERKQSEQKIAISLEHEHFLGNLIRNTSVAIGVGYPDGSLGLCNLAFQKLTGYGEEELKNISWNSVLTPQEYLESEMQLLAELHLTKQSVIYQKEYIHKSGKRVPIELVVHPVCDTNGKITCYYAFITDITERKQKEVELNLAKEKAEESDRLKSAFLANMSHEIRTPMNGILGFAGLLKEPELSGEQQKMYIQIIEKSGARMLKIINDIVCISKIESGIIEIYLSKTNINNQLQFVYDTFKLDADNKKLNLSFNCALPEKEAIINTDSEKLYGILSNLVKNAIKYTDTGTIEFGYDNKGAEFEFYVIDTGIGIPKERQEAIFERFIQADIADKMARQGAGLGLSIAKAYVEILGGKIWLESEEAKGSTFFFTLPRKLDSKVKINIPSTVKYESVSKPITSEISDLKVLIAEDDETSQMLFSIELEKISKKILKVTSGIDVIEACRKNPDIDFVLMDIQMPDMNGYEATRKIREFNKDVIIIAQTAFGLSGDREKAIEAGCNDYISKPINKDKLLSLIQKYFGK